MGSDIGYQGETRFKLTRVGSFEVRLLVSLTLTLVIFEIWKFSNDNFDVTHYCLKFYDQLIFKNKDD